MSKKLVYFSLIIFLLVLIGGCDFFGGATTVITTETGTTTTIAVTTRAATTIAPTTMAPATTMPTTTMPTTTMPTTTVVTTKEEVNYVINEEDYAIRSYLDGVEVIAYIGTAETIQIPTEIDGLTVIRIGNYAFNKNKVIETVSLPETIKEIGDYSFSSASNLQVLNLPASLESIGADIIQNCNALTEINVASGNIYFHSSNGILYHKIPDSNVSLLSIKLETMLLDEEDDDSYELLLYPQGKTDTYYEIENGIVAIGELAFKGNQYLEEIVIPNSVTVIGIGAFRNCTSLVTLDIPSSVEIIPKYMCFECSSLTNLTLSEGILSIARAAFKNCTSLSSLAFPLSLIEIEIEAFINIGTIQQIYLHDGLHLNGGSPFALNQSFVSYSVDATNTEYQVIDGVLYSADLSTLVSYPSGKPGLSYEIIQAATVIGDGAFEGNYYLEGITFAGDINVIEQYAFAECHSLKSIEIPENVQELSFYTFYKTYTIEELTVDQNNLYFESINDVIFSEDLSIIYFYPAAKAATSYTIPDTVIRINELAFFGSQYLENVIISRNLQTLGGGAFSSMENLTQINVVPENPYFSSVGGVLYSNDLTTLYIVPSGLNIVTYNTPASVTTIRSGAFQGNSYLEYLIIPSTVNVIFNYVFSYCDNLEWIVIPESVPFIQGKLVIESNNVSIYFSAVEEAYGFYYTWNLENRPYYFSGEWEYDNNGVPQVINPTDQTPVTITFESNDGSAISSITQTKGSVVTEPIPSIRTGYTFDGWYKDVSLTTLYTFNAMPSEDITVYAKWTINQYTITYVYTTDDINFDELMALFPDETITSISLGANNTSLLTSDGRVFMWGENDFGQLGDGTTMNRFTPLDITDSFNLNPGEIITSISLGESHASAMTNEGRIFTWGLNNFGQLGDGTTTNQSTPIDVTSYFVLNPGEKIISVTLGHNYSSAITSEGRMFTWGANEFGQLGNNTPNSSPNSIPIDITDNFNLTLGETIIYTDLGCSHSAALTSEGRLFLWGSNASGELGNDTTIDQYTPVDITNNFNLTPGEIISGISLGHSHSSAYTSTGRIFTWGNNKDSQLGDGTTTNQDKPKDITSYFNLNTTEMISSISLGNWHSLASTSEGSVFSWGYNEFGQLGDETNSIQSTPTNITGNFWLNPGEMIASINTGDSHSLLFTTDGRLSVWGYNLFGQLGDGTDSHRNIPTYITFESSILLNKEIYDYNETITEPIESFKEGYTFGGWYLDFELTQLFTFSTMPAEDIILYAKLEEEVQTYEIALITDSNAGMIISYNDIAWNSIVQYAETNNISYAYFDEETMITSIEAAIAAGAKIIVCPGYIFEIAIYEMQADYPQVAFLLLDGTPHSGDYSTYFTASNTHSVLYQEEQAGFLAGYAAVMDGYRNLGFMGGAEYPAMVRNGYGFIQGAEYAASELGLAAGDVTIRYGYANSFIASPALEAEMDLWYAEGTEIIFACGGGLYVSISAAAEKTIAGKVIGVDIDQAFESDRIITSAMKDIESSILDALTDFYNNDMAWPTAMAGQTALLGAENNGVCLPTDDTSWGFDTFTISQYDAIYAKLVDETVVVSQVIDVEPTATLITVEYEE